MDRNRPLPNLAEVKLTPTSYVIAGTVFARRNNSVVWYGKIKDLKPDLLWDELLMSTKDYDEIKKQLNSDRMP